MILEALLNAAIETVLGLLAEIGLGDEIRDLKERLTKSDERKRREAFEKAFAKAKEVVGEDVLAPLLDHRPFQEAIVNGLLDPVNGFDVQSAAEVWKDRFPEHARALRRFFTTLENALRADDLWGPILDRYEQQRFRREVQEALRARNLDLSPEDVVRRVSVHLSGSGAVAMSGGAAAGAGGVAVAGNVSQIVLQQIVMQSGARGASGNLRQRYLTRLLNQCRVLPLAALGGDAEPQKTVTLDQVFIDLNTTIEMPESLLEKIQQGEIVVEWWQMGDQITKWLHQRSGEGKGRAQRHEERAEEMRLLSALDALRLAPRLVLLGNPGAGKSSFAQMVIAKLAGHIAQRGGMGEGGTRACTGIRGGADLSVGQ